MECKNMKVKYFTETDTAHIEFTDRGVRVTKEISENIYIDVDEKGNIVSMTIEHAKANAGLREFSYQKCLDKPRKDDRKDGKKFDLNNIRQSGKILPTAEQVTPRANRSYRIP
jgi:uncharacterized protein YuzE